MTCHFTWLDFFYVVGSIVVAATSFAFWHLLMFICMYLLRLTCSYLCRSTVTCYSSSFCIYLLYGLLVLTCVTAQLHVTQVHFVFTCYTANAISWSSQSSRYPLDMMRGIARAATLPEDPQLPCALKKIKVHFVFTCYTVYLFLLVSQLHVIEYKYFCLYITIYACPNLPNSRNIICM